MIKSASGKGAKRSFLFCLFNHDLAVWSNRKMILCCLCTINFEKLPKKHTKIFRTISFCKLWWNGWAWLMIHKECKRSSKNNYQVCDQKTQCDMYHTNQFVPTCFACFSDIGGCVLDVPPGGGGPKMFRNIFKKLHKFIHKISKNEIEKNSWFRIPASW